MSSTNYPTALDDTATLPNPGATDDTEGLAGAAAGVPHNQQHTTLNDAVKALEAKLGTGATTPNVPGQYLGSNGAGQSAWQNFANIPQSAITGLIAALASKQAAGNYITALTGDIAASGPGSVSAVLASIITAGSVGDSTHIPVITYDAKGRIIGVTTAPNNAAADATTSSKGLVQLAGDLAGTAAAPTVPALANRLFKSAIRIQVGTTAPAPYTTDGVADEVQISAAFTALNAAGGGVLELLDASYHVSSNPIGIKDNVWIRGQGMNKTIIYGDSSLGTNAVMLAGGTSIGSPSTDVIFSDFTIDGSSMPTAPLSTFRKGIDAIYTLRWKFSNVRIYATPATGFGPDCNVDLRAEGCIADTCGRSASNPGYNGFGIGTGQYANESVQLVNCVARNCLNNGFLFEYVGGNYNSKNYQLTNCYAIGNNRGLRVSGTSGITLVNCVLANSTNEGAYIQLFGANNNYSTNVKIIGGEVYGNGADGIYCKDQEYGQFNPIMEGVHVYGNNGFGILCGASYAHLKNNIVFGNAKTGIFYHCYSAVTVYEGQIAGNTCYNNGTAGVAAYQDGIRVWGELGTIDGVQIYGNRCFDNQSVTNLTDGAINSGSATLNSASAAFTAYDIGKAITINGAGPAGGNLTSTILIVKSATQVIIANNASTTVSGATVNYGHAKTQQNGITLKADVINALVINNDVRGNASAGILDARTTPTDTSVIIRNNPGYNPEQVYAQGNVTGATTFDRTNGDHIVATLTGNVTSTIPARAIGDKLTLELVQDATGGRTVSKPSNVKLVGGAFSPSAGANARDCWTLRYDGTNWVELSRALNLS